MGGRRNLAKRVELAGRPTAENFGFIRKHVLPLSLSREERDCAERYEVS